MKLKFYLLLYITILFIYGLTLNAFANVSYNILSEININQTANEISSSTATTATGDSISIIITRNRWYGKIIEYDDKAFLYAFYFLKIPIMINNTNIVLFHFGFFLLLSYIFLMLIIKKFINKQ